MDWRQLFAGLDILALVLMLILKLEGLLDWEWRFILAPIWVPLMVCSFAFMAYLLFTD